MALLNFPTNPTVGQIYTIGTNAWVWTGSAWVKYTSSTQSPITVNTQTTSNGTNTGALVIDGGVGVSGGVNIGTTSTINGAEIISTSTVDQFAVTFITAGTDTAVSANLGNVEIWNTSTLQTVTDRGSETTNAVHITNATASIDTTTGALIVDGGVGIGGDLFVNGEIVATKLTIEYTTVTTISVQTDDVIQSSNATDSSSTTTGALIIAGGAGIGGNLYVGGEIVASKLTVEYTTVTTTLVQTDDIITTANDTESTSTTTGALVVTGGAGIGKTLSIGVGLRLDPGASITFGDGTVQTSRAPRFFTNNDVALGLTVNDMLPGDFYYDDSTDSIYILVDYGGYTQLMDLTVRAT